MSNDSLTPEEKTETCWSMDGSDFSYSSFGELLDANVDSLEIGRTVYEADIDRPDPSEFVDADDVIEIIECRGTDIGGEHADDFPDVTKDAKKELNELLTAWVTKHCDIRFYKVTKIREHKITAEDLT